MVRTMVRRVVDQGAPHTVDGPAARRRVKRIRRVPEDMASKYLDVLATRMPRMIVKCLCIMLIVVLSAWMAFGIGRIALDLINFQGAHWTQRAEHAVVDTLIMLAFLEVIRTLQAYLKLGRVRVTFIIDTALVVLVGELMGLWFNAYATAKVLMAMTVITLLVGLRVLTAKVSSNLGDSKKPD